MEVLFANLSVFEQFLSVFHSVFNFTLDVLSVQTCENPTANTGGTPSRCSAALNWCKKRIEWMTEKRSDWLTAFKVCSAPPESEQAAFNEVGHKSTITWFVITIWTGVVDSIILYIRQPQPQVNCSFCIKVTSQFCRPLALISHCSKASDIKSSTTCKR